MKSNAENDKSVKALVFEPYYGGSHKNFLQGLALFTNCELHLLTLPARYWKWRTRLSPLYYLEQLSNPGTDYDIIFCSTFVDVAALRGILPPSYRHLPVITYFHENQFVYPVRIEAERDFHFAVTNMTTAMASDMVLFNSSYNSDTFFAGCKDILGKAPDMVFPETVENIRQKSRVLHPGVDFTDIDSDIRLEEGTVPTIIWNHRWEHDKNPEKFFNALFELDEKGHEFRLIVLGEHFKERPDIFSKAEKILAHRIDHFGYVKNRREYCRLLQRGHLVVSTARHEFYGIAVIEAVRAGCRPLLPARLSYPEIFPAEFLYEDEAFPAALISSMRKGGLDRRRRLELTEKFSWQSLGTCYNQLFSGMIRTCESGGCASGP